MAASWVGLHFPRSQGHPVLSTMAACVARNFRDRSGPGASRWKSDPNWCFVPVKGGGLPRAWASPPDRKGVDFSVQADVASDAACWFLAGLCLDAPTVHNEPASVPFDITDTQGTPQEHACVWGPREVG